MYDFSSFKKFDLICFDFDGLLVDTEPFHFTSYIDALKEMKVPLDLDFWTYSKLAHFRTGSKLHQTVLESYPQFDRDWEEVRQLKRKIYSDMLENLEIELMPGVEDLLQYVQSEGIGICVVTNSLRNDTDTIRNRIPLLNQIPLWITKDLYQRGKPFPDGYLKALEHFPSIHPSSVVGLDDTLRGVHAMQGANIYPILVCNALHPQLQDKVDVEHFENLLEINITAPAL